MVILDPNGMNFDTVGAFGLAFQLLFNSGSSYCGAASKVISPHRWLESDLNFRLHFQRWEMGRWIRKLQFYFHYVMKMSLGR